jgi:hypothetical protein
MDEQMTMLVFAWKTLVEDPFPRGSVTRSFAMAKAGRLPPSLQDLQEPASNLDADAAARVRTLAACKDFLAR